MTQISRKIKSYLFLLYFVLVIFVFAYMYFYISYTAENYARTFAYENQEIYADNINGLINNERALLNESNYDGIVSNNTISFNGNTYQLNDSLLSHYDLAIFDDYLFVINNPYFKALLIKDLLTTATLNHSTDSLLIMNKEGLIYYYDSESINEF